MAKHGRNATANPVYSSFERAKDKGEGARVSWVGVHLGLVELRFGCRPLFDSPAALVEGRVPGSPLLFPCACLLVSASVRGRSPSRWPGWGVVSVCLSRQTSHPPTPALCTLQVSSLGV